MEPSSIGLTPRTPTANLVPISVAAPAPTSIEASDPVDVAALSSPSSGINAQAVAASGAKVGFLAGLGAGLHFASYGAIFKAEGLLTTLREKTYKPLEKLSVPTISIPFVLVPGWTTTPDNFQPLVNYLTRDGANGGAPVYVKQGAFFTQAADGSLQPAAAPPKDSKVFEMVFSDVHQSPDKNVVEMRQNFAAIQKLTGAAQVDAEGYSMGGIDSRLYVDQGGTAIRRLMLLGSPNRGTEFAALAAAILDKNVQWAQKFGGIIPDDRDSLGWLSPATKSPQLADLNSRWDEQRQKLPILTIGTHYLPTPGESSAFARGDGLVESSSLQLPHGETLIVNDSMVHGRLNDDETVQHLRATYFDWPMPACNAFRDDKKQTDEVRNFLTNWKPAPSPATAKPTP